MSKNKKLKAAPIIENVVVPFSLDRFKSKRPEETSKEKPRKAKAKAAKTERATFAQLPHEQFLQAYGKLAAAAYAVAFELDRLYITSRSKWNPVSFPNKTLGERGMHRSTKAKALRQLQAVGLIAYTLEGRGSFSVTLMWRPWRPQPGPTL